jgi:hypothetical protein
MGGKIIGGRSHVVWEDTKIWCRTHPNRKAIIVSKEGTFTLMFQPPQTDGDDEDDHERIQCDHSERT